MKCQDIDKIIFKYSDGQISPKMSNRVALHLNSCPNCHNKYRLTQIEGEILRNKEDLPSLSPDFTAKVMKSLQSTNCMYTRKKGISASIGRTSLSKRKVWLGSMTAVAAVIALWLYLPQSFVENKLGTFDSPFLKSSSNSTAIKQYADSTQNRQADVPENVQSSETQNIPESLPATNDTAIMEADTAPNMSADILSLDTAPTQDTQEVRQIASVDTYKSSYSESAVADSTPIYLVPRNIPDRLKFVQVNNDMDNNTIYSYASLDGKESLQLTLKPSSSESTADLFAAADADTRQAVSTVSREIQNGDQNFIVVFSGNIPIDELKYISNSIQFENTMNN